MAEVVLADPEAEGLPAMLAGLLEAAVTDPAKARLLEQMRGTVTIVVPDAEVEVGLRFSGGTCRVHGSGIPGSAVRVTMPSDWVMGLSTTPLMLGMPSLLSPEGRAFNLALLRRQIRISGLQHLTLIRQLNTLLSLV